MRLVAILLGLLALTAAVPDAYAPGGQLAVPPLDRGGTAGRMS